MKLSNIPRKFIESYPGNGRMILTHNGYKEILFVHKTIPYKKFKITLENGKILECAFNHVIIKNDFSEVYAKDSLGQIIKTIDGDSKVIYVEDLNIEEHMFDISIDSEDELYYSNGILSHNSGKSVSTGIYLSWQYEFNKDLNIGIVGNKGAQAREFLRVVKNILLELPMWLKQGTAVWNKGSIENESKMAVLTDVPNSDAFRGFTISILVIDEVAFIKNSVWNEFIDSIMPSQSGLAWKKNIFISTMKGMNHWYEILQGAEKGTNGFTLFDLDWKRVPRFNAKGELMTPDEFKEKIVKRFGLLYFNQNYANEAIGSSHTLIKSESLKAMTALIPEEIRDGKLNVYFYPEKGHKYITTVDAAKDGTDNFSVQITDITDINFKQVASAKLQIDYLLMPEFIHEWASWYNNSYLIIENNEGAGQSIADQIYKDYEYENLHFDKDGKKKKKYPGFRTTAKSRKLILQTMKLFIENNKYQVNDKSTISEFFQFVLINNKFQADEGCHDDMIMSLALTFVPFCNTENFEDMKDLVKDLYSVEDSEDSSFSEYLTIGNFDDGIPETDKPVSRYWNGFEVIEAQEGFM